MKRIIALVASLSLLLTSCASNQQVVVNKDEVSGYSGCLDEEKKDDANGQWEENAPADITTESISVDSEDAVDSQNIADQEMAVENLDLSDERLHQYLEDKIYQELLDSFDDDEYAIDDIETVYYSKEYIENLSYNSQENVYFGFTQSDLDTQFSGEKYVFTLADDGTTAVEQIESYEDHSAEEILKNVAIGSGVILVCVTVSVVTGGAAPAVSMIFAVGAKTGAVMALSGGAIGGISAGIVKGYQTGNFSDVMQAAATGASDGFKWGAISGVISGGASEVWGLRAATKGGLKINEVALIQKDSHYPLSLIQKFHSMKEYEVFKDAGLKTMMVDGKTALVQSIDLNYVDEATGKTNLQLMQQGNAPIDPVTEKPYELHHIGQQKDSPLAVLTWEQHRGKGNMKVLHEFLDRVGTENPSSLSGWGSQKADFWMDMAKQLAGG